MKLAFSTLGCPDWDITQVAEKAAEYGFDGVELRIKDDRHVDSKMSISERKAVREMFSSKGVEIPALAGYTVFCGDDTAELNSNGEMLLKNAQLASDMEVPYLRSFPGGRGITNWGIDALHRYCEKVKPLGVTVLMETHDSMKTGKQAAKLLRDVNSDGLAILWDIHHSITDNETPEDTWQAVGKHIHHLHIKDGDSAHKPCLMGEGVLPIPEIVKLLKEKGFKGFLSFEWEKTWIPELAEPEIVLPEYMDYMKKIMHEKAV
ncbi:MAG: sugar phosphate isomerase/epimerase [Defluviitaleaceae bacterium]|nr:sugar phosphate isomerase/epimerase [Defluviitaleaceae bacterium]